MNEAEGKRRVLDFIEDAIFDAELERVANMSPEELREELKKEGVDPARAKAVAERAIAEADRLEKEKKAGAPAAAPPPTSNVVRIGEARAARPFWRRTPMLLAAAAMFLLTIGLLARQSPTIVAYFSPPQPSETPRPPTPNQLMAETRAKAFAACALKDFDACARGLDEAKKTDPAGDTDVRVARARATLLRHAASLDCERLYWTHCTEKLDQAKELDPDGDNADDVRKMRDAVHAAPTAPTGTVGVKLY